MSKFVKGVKSRLKAFSPDRSVAGDASVPGCQKQDGAEANVNNEKLGKDVSDAAKDMVAEVDIWECSQCDQSWDSRDTSKPDLMACSFCVKWFCRSCIKMSKSEFKALSREDAFWACCECKPIVTANIELMNRPDLDEPFELSKQTENSHTELGERINSLENSIETLIVQMGQNETKMTKLYSDALKVNTDSQAEMGEKSGTVNAAIDTINVEQMVKNALNEQKKVELDRENRSLNFIIHRIPESDKPDPQSRKKDDLQLIEKLFGELEVDYEPKQCFRLGRFDKEADPDTRKPRPLKVIMNSQEEQAQVMMNLSKLRDAPEFLKKLSISPDLSREERDELNEKLREAKQLTSESPNLIFKVKGTPGNYHFIKILKSRNDQKTSLSSKPAPKNQAEPSKTTAKTDA